MDLHGEGRKSVPQISPWTIVSRASQVDASQIDERTSSRLLDQLKSVFSLHPTVFEKFKPELTACLRLFIWRFSIWTNRPTAGSALKGLRYRNESAFHSLLMGGEVRTGLEGPGLSLFQKFGFLVSMVIVPYGWDRLQNYLDSEQEDISNRTLKIKEICQSLEKTYKILSLMNTLVFLHNGRYHNIVDRLLMARLVYQKPNTFQQLNPEELNRQLVWGEFLELSLVLLPFFKNLSSWTFFRRTKSKGNIDKDSCPICAAKPITIPYVALPCRHVYCYYCLKTRFMANRGFKCVTCNQEIINLQHFKNQEEG